MKIYYYCENIDINLFNEDVSLILSEKIIKSKTKNKDLEIRLSIKETDRDINIFPIKFQLSLPFSGEELIDLNLYVPKKESIFGYEVTIDKKSFEDYLNGKILMIGTRGIAYNLPFDRMHIIYDDI